MRPINPSNSLSPPPSASPVNLSNAGSGPPFRPANNSNSNNDSNANSQSHGHGHGHSNNTTSSTWDKPERARTSHACEPCRERKTKCDGSRPACRRCLHTGTTCYYGYGKGWRKRKTAEDLTATSRRLARYETLLNQIMPMVSPEVRALIEDAGETDGSNASNTSETPEIDFGVPPQRLDSGLVGPGGRIILPLPVPSPHVPVVSRSSTSSGTFEVVPGTTVGPPPSVPPPPSLPSGTPASSSNVSTSQRLSPDSIALTRLPSITSEGILLETGRAPDLSPPPTGPPPLLAQGQLVPDSTGSYGPERLGSLQALPSHTSLGETPRLPQFSPG
ncbi:hypothetical protein HRR83_004400 [Exophiala dermatitidis]|uniref:Zn(2)-C6 fungal-type domain-containing protein n=1 Tax=Exophiala dermatitidis TaxID=5970 RepID=A0AAN6ESK6_EXODE|nr:hypothetical protein HRR73_006137 [Exophiala dermatitidis]KAJ4521295.1 hypothetical protein HRR74_003118 [Exophiala dermatitidis]KAJ4541962.1 hypothetical protein HRR77_005853 [Exophiala dermatitidis]KAJ4544727.1 hypothetical protein HRR76_002771 [Exophiala dermatitidis]KAJ4565203.1 hypothetical protein HRR79_005472 [Exophiala dermatitidis]